MLTDAQTPFLGTPLVPLRIKGSRRLGPPAARPLFGEPPVYMRARGCSRHDGRTEPPRRERPMALHSVGWRRCAWRRVGAPGLGQGPSRRGISLYVGFLFAWDRPRPLPAPRRQAGVTEARSERRGEPGARGRGGTGRLEPSLSPCLEAGSEEDGVRGEDPLDLRRPRRGIRKGEPSRLDLKVTMRHSI